MKENLPKVFEPNNPNIDISNNIKEIKCHEFEGDVNHIYEL